MNRGEIWTASGAGYAGKPRPVLVIQSDLFPRTESVSICPMTTTLLDLPLVRVPVRPTPENGLQFPTEIMVDKVTTVRRRQIQQRVGLLEARHLDKVDEILLLFFGLADTASRQTV